MTDIKILETKTKHNTNHFNFKNHETMCKIIDVYDGDTCKGIFWFNNNYYIFTFRLLGIDTPELKSKDDKEREAGIISRDKLRSIILDKIVKIRCGDFDKYGRILVEIFDNNTNESINNSMLVGGYGCEYDGKTKKKFEKVI